MTTRALQETLVACAIAALALFVGAGVLSLGAAPAPDAFLRHGPAGLLAVLGVPFVLWAFLVAAANLLGRRGGPVVKLTVNGALTLAVAAFTAAFWAALAVAQGGFATLLIGVAVMHSLLFAIAALIALAITHLAVFRAAPFRPQAA